MIGIEKFTFYYILQSFFNLKKRPNWVIILNVYDGVTLSNMN